MSRLFGIGRKRHQSGETATPAVPETPATPATSATPETTSSDVTVGQERPLTVAELSKSRAAYVESEAGRLQASLEKARAMVPQVAPEILDRLSDRLRGFAISSSFGDSQSHEVTVECPYQILEHPECVEALEQEIRQLQVRRGDEIPFSKFEASNHRDGYSSKRYIQATATIPWE